MYKFVIGESNTFTIKSDIQRNIPPKFSLKTYNKVAPKAAKT